MPEMTPDCRIEPTSDDEITAGFSKEKCINMQPGNVSTYLPLISEVNLKDESSIDEGTATKPRGAPHSIGIYRAFSNDRGGHYLHVSINRNGKMYQRYFPERRCGGEQHAMKLALAWRDNIIAKHPPMSLMKFCSILRTNNTSGMAGISRAVKRSRAKSGRIIETVYWQSRVPMADGKCRSRNFSVSKLGEDGAKLRAIEDRMQGLVELGDVAFRQKRLPQPGSSADDIALMTETLRAPAERHMREIAERCAKREQHASRVAEMLAQAQAAEEAALDRIQKRGGEQYIGRYATPKGTSFYWRVSFHRQGTHHRKCFSDSVYGGTAQALMAAKTWRDRLFRTLPVDSKAVFVARVKATNTSGVAGVNRTTEARKGRIFYAWVAHRPHTKGLPGHTKKYSVSKYGEKEAFALAVSARETFLAELRDIEFLHNPAARQLKRTLLAE